MLAALCSLTFAGVHVCAYVCGPVREVQGTGAPSVKSVAKGDFPKVELSQTALLSFCFGGGGKKKVYHQLAL